MEKLGPYLLVGLGGFIGAIARFALGGWVSNRFPSVFPIGTFLINVTGSFILGIVATLAAERLVHNPETLRLVVGVGFLGAYTTFSTFEYETSALINDGAFLVGGAYVVSSLLAGFVGVRLGIILARVMG